VRIEAAYWFGSTVRKGADEDSDIDVAVVSPDFTALRFQNAKKLFPAVIRVDSRIEIHPYSPSDFNEGTPLVSEIIRTGKKIV